MRRIFIGLSALLLAGCPSLGDRAPVDYPAHVSIRDGGVCVTVMPEADEKLEAISIYRLDETEKRKITFFDTLQPISPNQCVPAQGYVFTEGQQYHFSAKLTSKKKSAAGDFPFSREFITEFSLKKINNNLHVDVIPKDR
ncbi:putative T6SS immunity periplasmic lipoprotein [Brenneria corticis]|nr:putative T6SS immunity periplasmic lipoprotein [Brenneria sp. CFCC 11842]